MRQDRIGVGIVGVTPGRSWATMSHIPALKALPEFELIAVANSNARSAAAAAASFGIPKSYGDIGDLVRDPEVDLVVVTVRVPHHRTIVDAALDAGKMVYCEWPLGRDLEDASAMADHARRRGIRTAVGLQARSSPVLRYVRDLVREGYVGEVLSTTLVGSGRSWGAEASEPHAYTHDRSHGATLLSIPVSHTMDALCHCLGEVSEVQTVMATRRSKFRIEETGEERSMAAEDQVVIAGVLETGTILAVHYRGGLSRGTNLLWEINGTEGDLQITSSVGHAQMFDLSLKGGRLAAGALTELDVPGRYKTVPPSIDGFALNVAEAYRRFSKGGGEDPTPDFDAAVKRHRFIDAVERSARSGKRVTIGPGHQTESQTARSTIKASEARTTGTEVLRGMTAFISGGSGTIGLATAAALVRDGASILLMARGQDSLAEARAALLRRYPDARVALFRGDGTDEGDVQAALAATSELGDQLDIIISTVGQGEFRSLLHGDSAAFSATLERNIMSAFFAMRHGAPLMKRGGSITCISSTVALRPARWMSAYAAAKAGLEGLVRSAAEELADFGIRVNAIRPGPVRSNLRSALFDDPEMSKRFIEQIPLGRFGAGSDVAEAVRYLVGPGAGYVTGQIFAVDGGSELRRQPDITDLIADPGDGHTR